MKYSFVCTNYNNTHFTVTAVESLMAGEMPPSHVVIVDNASSPADVTQLKNLASRFSIISLVLNDENIGYFPGLNAGLRRLRSANTSCNFTIVGNNDLEFPVEFGRVLSESAGTLSSYSVVAPDIVTLDGIHQNPHVRLGISAAREILYDLYFHNFLFSKLIVRLSQFTNPLSARRDSTLHRKPGIIREGIGACYILTEKFFERFHELSAPVFLMGEEYFLTHQIENSDLSMYYEPALVVKHRCNGALEKVSSHKIWSFGRESHKLRRSYADRGRLRTPPMSAPASGVSRS